MNEKSAKISSLACSTLGILAVIICLLTSGTAYGVLAAAAAVCACVVMYSAYFALKQLRTPAFGRLPNMVYFLMAVHAVLFAVSAFVKSDAMQMALNIAAALVLLMWCATSNKKLAEVSLIAFAAHIAAIISGVFSLYITLAVMAALLAIGGITQRSKGGLYPQIGIATGVSLLVLSVIGLLVNGVDMRLYISAALLLLMFIMTLAGAFKPIIPAATLSQRDMDKAKKEKAEIKQPQNEDVIRAAKKGKAKKDAPLMPSAVPDKKAPGNAYARAVGRAYGGSTKIASAAADNAAAVANDAKMKMVDKEYLSNDWKALLTAPVYALKGVTEADAELLASIGIKTISDLAENKFFSYAKLILDNK